MNPRLVTDLDLGRELGEGLLRRLDHQVLGLPRQVRSIEVEQVIVLDAIGWRSASDDVPHGLEQAARGQIPARQFQRRGLGEHLRQNVVSTDELLEAVELFIYG
jgi:hypothetical protein